MRKATSSKSSKKSAPKNSQSEIIAALKGKKGTEQRQLMVIGRKGTAKVELMKELILQDLSGNHCVVVVDTTGHLSEILIDDLSNNKEISSRLVLIDPASTSSPFGFMKFNNEADATRKSELIADAFRMIFQNQIAVSEANEIKGWSSQIDDILRNALLLLMYTGKNLHDLETILTETDFRDILLESISKREPLSVSFKQSLLNEWASYRRLARTERWLDLVEPIILCTKLILRPETCRMFDFKAPWLENDSSNGNVIVLRRGSLYRPPEEEPRLAADEAARKKLDWPDVVRKAIEDAEKVSAEVGTGACDKTENVSNAEKFDIGASSKGQRYIDHELEYVLDLESLIDSRKIVVVNLSLRAMQMDASPVAEAVAAVFLTSLIGSARNLWSEQSSDHACVIFSNSYDSLLSPKTIQRLCRDHDKYKVALRLCSNGLPVKGQVAADKLIDDMENVAAFAVSRADAELLGSELFRCSEGNTDKVSELMRQSPRSYYFYQARTGELTEHQVSE